MGRILSEEKIWVYGVNFWKKRKFYTWNLTNEQKQPPVVILEQAILYSIFCACVKESSNQDA